MTAAVDPVILSLKEMIDQAIGTPDVGVVDFNMLHTVLHCIVQQLHAENKNVELRGSIAALPVGRDHSQTINVTEFIVDTGPKGKDYKQMPEGGPAASDETILVAERKKTDTGGGKGGGAGGGATEGAGAGGSAAGGADSGGGGGGGGGPRTAASATSHVSAKKHKGGAGGGAGGGVDTTSSLERLSLVTLSKFNVLQETVDDLKSKVYGTIPKNEDILEEVRSQTNIKAITDMWNTLNVQSRLEAAEAGITKLSSLVQDLISESQALQEISSKTSAAVSAATGLDGTAGGGKGHAGGGKGAGGGGHGGAGGAHGGAGGGQGGAPVGQSMAAIAAMASQTDGFADMTGGNLDAIVKNIKDLRNDVDKLKGTFHRTMNESGIGVVPAMSGVQSGVQSGVLSGAQSSAPSGGQSMAALAAMAQTDGGGFADMSDGNTDAIMKNIQDLRTDLDNLYITFFRTMNDCGIEPALTGDAPSAALAAAMATATKKLEALEAAGVPAGGKGGFIAGPGAGTGRAVGPDAAFGPVGIGVAVGGAIPPPASVGTAATFDTREIDNKLFSLEKRLKDCCEDFARTEGRLQDKVTHLEEQVDYGLKQLGVQTGDLAASKLSPEVMKDLQGLMELFSTVQGMQEQLTEVHKTAVQLAAEKEERRHHINTLLEQIELLKIIKMDKEDMAEAMADKADVRMLARKVSQDQFEIACDNLAKGLDQAIGKLNMQESLWQQVLDDIQREIETKLDKMELTPVKDFFNNKLKQLQENLKQLASLRREVEAAGTKRRLLREVNCISCDANAVMAMDAGPSMPSSKPMPAMHSMKPYLSYELDTIRKTQASNLQQRNMHDWENVAHQMAHPKPLQKVRSETDKHLCNRYCGGSHTVTTPAQRVARLGHFVKQWGPDVLPLTSGLAAGDDGKMYKVTNQESAAVGPGGAVDTCTPRSPPPRKPSDAKPSQKPIVISAECRCLEGEKKQ